MSLHLWHGLTALGDGAVLLPCALLMLVWLLAVPETRRSGWLWLLAVLVVGGGVALTKLLYMAWDLHPPGWDFIGLSGHGALSFLFWPVAGAVVIGRNRPWLRVLLIALGACLALVITISRLVLHDHSPLEAILGAVWGALVAAVFLLLAWRHPVKAPALRRWIGLSVLLMIVLTFGHKFPSNRILTWTALQVSGHTVIYTRCDLGPKASLAKDGTNCHGKRSALIHRRRP